MKYLENLLKENTGFFPMTQAELKAHGIRQPDFICITGDAYVDHPSFGIAVIGRVLAAKGYSVAMIAQPDWKDKNAFSVLGEPRLAFLVTAGNIDSMVSNYTAAKRKRSDDAYSTGGKGGKRPDRALTVYTKAIKARYPSVPVLVGGLEASLRRFASYDYWDDTVHPSVLFESGADILMYGMGELAIAEIADRLNAGERAADIADVRGTCVAAAKVTAENAVVCSSFEDVVSSKRKYAEAVKIEYEEHDFAIGKTVYQAHGSRFLKQNPPMRPLTREEFDRVYELPYQYAYPPVYETLGGVPAIEEVEFSIIHNRGCFGACNFCSLAFHQGRTVTSRSKRSLIEEAKEITKRPGFKGFIHDVGGPTANFRAPSCQKQLTQGMCKNKKCLSPAPCPALQVSHSEYLDILKEMRELPGVKKVFVRSGIRFDYLIADKDNEFFRELVKNHISGQLKVAPEHMSDNVLRAMGKPPVKVFDTFCGMYEKFNREYKKEQFLVPYLMSSHPGSTLGDAIALTLYLKKHGIRAEQVQDFYPTPGTLSTCMFYTGIDPLTGKHIYVPRSAEEKEMQRALLQYFKPQNYDIVRKALKRAGRSDLIGYGKDCLVPPDRNVYKPGMAAGEQTKTSVEFNKKRKSSTEFGRKQRPAADYGEKRKPSAESGDRRKPAAEYNDRKTPADGSYAKRKPAQRNGFSKPGTAKFGSKSPRGKTRS